MQEGYCNFISCISVNFQNVQMSPQIACLRMQSLIGCICLTILHCAFTDAPSASSEHLNQRKYIYIGCICFSFLPCAFSNVSSNRLPEKMQSHIGCICLTFLTVRFQMCPQILKSCICICICVYTELYLCICAITPICICKFAKKC